MASAANIPTEFPSKRKSKRRAFLNEPEDEEMVESTADDQSAESEEGRAFKLNVFYIIT